MQMKVLKVNKHRLRRKDKLMKDRPTINIYYIFDCHIIIKYFPRRNNLINLG
jgi:hypothetical protein